jgi:hypothetical protein
MPQQVKISDLVASTTPGADALLEIETAAGASRKCTIENLIGTISGTAPQTFTSASGVLTEDWNDGHIANLTLTENITSIVWTAPTHVGAVFIILTQDSTPRTITWPASVEWPGDVAPTLTPTSGGKMILSFLWDGTSYWGSATTYS